MDTAKLAKMVLGTLVRLAMTAATGYFIKQHLLTAEQGASLVHVATDYAIIVAPALGATIWTVTAKYRAHSKLLLALQMPAGSTLEDLKAVSRTALGERQGTFVP